MFGTIHYDIIILIASNKKRVDHEERFFFVRMDITQRMPH